MAEVLEIEEPLQDDPPRKKLYKGLVSKGLYTKSYQDFEGQFSTPESIGKLYKNMYDKGLYTKTDKDFTSQFFSETPKKKENFNSPIQSSGEVGGEFGKTKTVQEPFDPLKQQKKIFTGLNKEPTDTFQLESVGEPVSRKPITPRVMTLEEYSKTLDKTPVADQTQIDKPLSEIEIKEQIKRGEQHKKNVGIAIDNTVKQYFKLKGIKTGTNSQLYQEQKEKLQKAYEDGEVSYHMDLKTNTPRLDKVTGFWENISKGWNAAMDANDEAATFVHDMNTQDRVNFIKQKQAEQLKQQENLGAFIGEREGGAGWLGHTVGGAAPFLAKAGLGALTGAALLAAAPETMGASLAAAPVAFSFLYTAPDMANQGAMNETLRRYEQIKKENPEMSDIDAMGQAESGMLTGGIAGITENALFMKTMKLPISNEGKQVIGKFATETLQSGMNMGTATAVTDVAKNIVSGMEGYKQPTRDIVKSAVNTFTENATVGMVLHGMISGVPKILNSAFKYSLKDTPKQEVTEILNNNVEAGTITPEQAKKVAEDIDGYNQALDKINPRGLSETSQASIAGLIQAKENLKKEAETKDESVRKPYEDKIEAISQQIADIQRTNKPFEHEIDDLTGNTLAKPSFDEVAKQRVQDVADKISKGKEVEDVVDIQTETKFPEQLEKELNKILREEKSANKDKEKPNNEITNNIEKYLAKNKKEQPTPPTEVKTEKSPPSTGLSRGDVETQQHTAGNSTIALDYLFTGGRDVILSTDYLLQALVGGFEHSAKEIDAIRNKYANKLGNIKDDINSDVYNSMMQEIREVINKKYNSTKANEIFDKILKNATGFTVREGNQVSIELEKLNEQILQQDPSLSSNTPSKPSTVLSRGDVEEKFVTQSGINRADAKKIYNEVRQLDEPTDAKGLALSYLAHGGKVGEDAINEVSGRVKRASLNTGARELKSSEVKARDYADKNGKGIDEIVHEIWDNLPEGLQNKIDIQDIKNELQDAIKNHDTRLSSAKEYIKSYGVEEPVFADEKIITEEEIKLNEYLNSESEKTYEHEILSDNEILNIINHVTENERENQQSSPNNKSGSSETNISNDSKKEPSTNKEVVNETKETEIPVTPEKEILPEKRVIEETQGAAEPFTEEKRTILSHRGLQEVATEFALDDVTPRDRKTDPQLFKDAEQTATKWNNEGVYPEKIEGLVKKAEEAEVLTDEQRVILQQHIANVRGEISSMNITDPNYDARLQELNRLVRAGETTRSAAGAALRVPYMGSVPNDLPSMMVEEMRVSKTGELTTGQKETVQREYTDISRAEKAYQQKVEALEAENAKLRAGKKVAETKATTKPRKEHTDFVAERKKITESISDKLKKARQDTNVVIVPYAKELIAIAPDVAKLMKSYVEEGIVKLEDITKKIHDELKGYIPDLQEKDVHDIIAGKYNEKKRTKNEIAENIENIRLQAKLVNKLEDLYRGEEPKTEKLKIKRNAEIEKLRNEIKDIASFDKEVAAKKEAQLKSSEAKNKELEKELSKYESKTPKKKPEAEVLESLKLKMIKEAESLKEQIRTGNFEKVEKKEPLKLDSEALKLRDEVIKLRQNREVRLILQQRMNETGRQKGMRLAAEVLNVPRTLMTIGDFSGLLRQDIFFAAGHPKETLNAAKEMFKSGWSQKEYDRWYADLKETPRYPIMQKSKLSITDSINHDLTKREEDYMSSLSEKIPFLGKSIVKGSERSYTALLNQSRVTRFNEFADAMEARGITYDNNPKSYKAMAEYINNATGRSDFGETLNRVAPILNSVFFSPRLIASRVNMLSYWMQPRFWTNLPKEVRIDYMRNWISLLAIGGSILALSKMGGADVEDDPRSSDFGKIKSGNTRWDIWGGAQPYMRVLAQTISGQRKSTKSGKMYELNGDDIFGETRAGVVTDFFRNKLAPVPGSVVDILSGRTGVGDRIVYQWGGAGNKEISLDQYVKQRLLPMTITGTQEAMKDQGVKALFTVAIPSTFGVGTQTYGNENSTTKPVKKAQPKKPMKKVSKIEK